jgi:peroxiredoxin
LIAKGQVVADAYKVGLYPTNFVIDGNGKIVFKKNGYSETIKQEIQKVINRV